MNAYPGMNSNILVSDPVSVGDGSEDLLQVTITLQGLGGGIPGAFDGSFVGTLHQQDLLGVASPTTDDPIPGTNVASDIDSHFLLSSGDVLTVAPPGGLGLTENFGLPSSSSEATNATGTLSASVNTSFGTHLSGTWAFFDPQSAVLPLAQIVVPAGNPLINYDFVVNIVGEGLGEETYAGTIAVPEPSSFQLAALIFVLSGARFGSSRCRWQGKNG